MGGSRGTGSPYRDIAGVHEKVDHSTERVREYETDAETLEVELLTTAGLKFTMNFYGDDTREPNEFGLVIISRGESPHVKSGLDKFHEFLVASVKQGFAKVNDSYFPWHQVARVSILKHFSRPIKFRWRYADRVPFPT